MIQAPYQFPNQTSFYKGKVRDVYGIGDHLLMITSDRISAFDVVLPKLIPYKGQVLNQIASYFCRKQLISYPTGYWPHQILMLHLD